MVSAQTRQRLLFSMNPYARVWLSRGSATKRPAWQFGFQDAIGLRYTEAVVRLRVCQNLKDLSAAFAVLFWSCFC